MKYILSILLILSFTVTPFAQPTTELEKALENALTDCRSDYYSLSKRYHTLDSAIQKSNIQLRTQLKEAEKATKEAEKQSKIALEKADKKRKKQNLLYGIFGGLIGIISGSIFI